MEWKLYLILLILIGIVVVIALGFFIWLILKGLEGYMKEIVKEIKEEYLRFVFPLKNLK